MVVLIQIASIYQFTPCLVESKSKQSYTALFRKPAEHPVGLQIGKSRWDADVKSVVNEECHSEQQEAGSKAALESLFLAVN